MKLAFIGTIVLLTVASGLTVPTVDAVVGTDTVIHLSGVMTAPGFSGDNGPAGPAQLNQPRDTDQAPDGSIYIADTFNHRIRKIDNGVITTVAGNGSTIHNGDGIAATNASLYWPHDVAIGPDGTLYIADSQHHRIRKVVDGVITTIAGTGVSGSTGDGGLAIRARLKNPKSVAYFKGAIYTAGLDQKVRRIDLVSGIITLVAGTGLGGYAGDGGPATSAQLRDPQRLVLDSIGNIYIADTTNNAVRRIAASTGVITTVAGTGAMGNSGDGGKATSAQLNTPRGIDLENDKTLYVADSGNHRVRRIDLARNRITTVAGTVRGDSGDGGPAASAKFYNPRGLTVLDDGSLLIADTLNNVLRKVTPTP